MGLFERGEPPVEVYGEDEGNGYVMVIGEEPRRKAREFDTALEAIRHYNAEVKREDHRAVIGSEDREVLYPGMDRRPSNAAHGKGEWAVDVHELGTYSLPMLVQQETVDPRRLLEPVEADEMVDLDFMGATPVDLEREVGYDDLMGYEVAARMSGGELYALARGEVEDAVRVGPGTSLMRFDREEMRAAQRDVMKGAEGRMADVIAAAATLGVAGAVKEDESLLERAWNRRSPREILFGDHREPREFDFYHDLVRD